MATLAPTKRTLLTRHRGPNFIDYGFEWFGKFIVVYTVNLDK